MTLRQMWQPVTRSEADIAYLLVLMAFCTFGLPWMEFSIPSSEEFGWVTERLAAWSNVREGLWYVYLARPFTVFAIAVLASLAASLLFRVVALRVALIAGVAAVVARHVLFDHVFLSFEELRMLSDLMIIFGVLVGVLCAGRLRRSRSPREALGQHGA